MKSKYEYVTSAIRSCNTFEQLFSAIYWLIQLEKKRKICDITAQRAWKTATLRFTEILFAFEKAMPDEAHKYLHQALFNFQALKSE